MRHAVSLFPLRPQQMVEVAIRAENLGFDAVWIGEHVISPLTMESRYPYARADEGAPAYHARLPFYDPYAALSYLAARTESIRLGLSLSVVPLHDPYHLARSVATVDQFSGGRFVFGAGSGWLREEFEIVGRPWDRRGARMEEALELMITLWTDQDTTFDGEFFKLPPSAMEPKPATLPHPPIYLGGTTPVALDRAARLGDGWIGAGIEPPDAAPVVCTLRHQRAALGLDDRPFEVCLITSRTPTRKDIDVLDRAGVDHVIVRPWAKGRDAVDSITTYAEQVMPS